MWQDNFKEMGLPASSMAKFEFTDGQPKVYSEKEPLKEDSAPVVAAGQVGKGTALVKGLGAASECRGQEDGQAG